ncbi:hypothetical protein DUHN20_12710 [Helicobacter pylori]
MELESTRASETQKLNEAGNALKTQLKKELEALKASIEAIKPQIQSVTKFLGNLCLWQANAIQKRKR